MNGSALLIDEVKMHSFDLDNDVPPLDFTSLNVKKSITCSTGHIPTATQKSRDKIKKPSSDPTFPGNYYKCSCKLLFYA